MRFQLHVRCAGDAQILAWTPSEDSKYCTLRCARTCNRPCNALPPALIRRRETHHHTACPLANSLPRVQVGHDSAWNLWVGEEKGR